MPAQPQRDDDLDGLTPEQILRAKAIKAELAGGGRTLREFIAWQAPHEPPPPHLQAVIDVVERARTEQIQVCISMPPRHGKTITLQRALAWWLSATPSDACAYVSYSGDQAKSKAGPVHALARAAGVEVGSRDTLGEWRTADGGGLLAAGAGGGLTGQGVHGLMIYDDPYQDREEAESPAQREKVWDRFCDVVLTRNEGQSVIVVQTRWHPDDLIGRLVRDRDWPCINFAAIAEPDDPLGRAPGEALWPDRHPLEELQAVRAINAHTFASMFQGRPRPRGATVFKTETYYDPDTFSMEGCRLSWHCDAAGSARTSADYGAIVAVALRGYGEKTEGFVLDVYRQQVEIPQFVRDVRAWQIRLGNHRVNIDGASGTDKAVAQMLREIDSELKVRECVPVGDKFTRAQAAATAWNEGRLRVPMPKANRPVPWLKAFLAEVTSFTGVNDTHDDQVDCLSGAWNEGYRPNPTTPTKREGPLRARRI
jgi:predicted phage terminase large subunit-like protein